MGFAIFIIVFYHFCNVGGTTLFDKACRFAFSQGYVGVDIFMVVSGLGLAYSMMKDESLKKYYLKRWVRIFPFFTFITLVECWLIRGESFGLALLRSTTIGYWTGLPYIDWYVPAIVGLYVVFPLLYHTIVKPRRYKAALAVSLFFLVVSVLMSIYPILDWKHFALLYRIPDFIMGAMCAVAIKDGYDRKVVTGIILISTCLGAVLFLLLQGIEYNLWLTNLCLTPLYLLVLCKIYKVLSINKIGGGILLLLSLLGVMSLELYRISSSFERLLSDENTPSTHFLFVFLFFSISVFLSYIAHYVFDKVNSYLYKRLSNYL